MSDDRELLAWAAGVFEASGSATRSGGAAMLNLKQKPPVGGGGMVERFHAAIDGRGRVGGPYPPSGVLSKSHLAMWYARGEEASEIMALLWPWLGPEKRAQWERVIGAAGE